MTTLVLVALAGMLAVDLYFIIRVGAIDRGETERYLDEAEHWLTSWKAPLIKTVTLATSILVKWCTSKCKRRSRK